MITIRKHEDTRMATKGDLITTVMNDPSLKEISNVALFVMESDSDIRVHVVTVHFNGESVKAKSRYMTRTDFFDTILDYLSYWRSITILHDTSMKYPEWFSEIIKAYTDVNSLLKMKEFDESSLMDVSSLCSRYGLNPTHTLYDSFGNRLVQPFMGNVYFKKKKKWNRMPVSGNSGLLSSIIKPINPQTLKMLHRGNFIKVDSILDSVKGSKHIENAVVHEKYKFICEFILVNGGKGHMIFTKIRNSEEILVNMVSRSRDYKFVLRKGSSMGEMLDKFIEINFDLNIEEGPLFNPDAIDVDSMISRRTDNPQSQTIKFPDIEKGPNETLTICYDVKEASLGDEGLVVSESVGDKLTKDIPVHEIKTASQAVAAYTKQDTDQIQDEINKGNNDMGEQPLDPKDKAKLLNEIEDVEEEESPETITEQ